MKKVLNFIKNTDGNFAPLMALMALPIFGGVALSVDYSNLTRLKTELRSAADATCVPVAKMFLSGDSTDAQVKAFGAEFFAGNFNKNSRFTSDANLEITLPNEAGTKPGGNPRRELMCEGKVTYHPIFGPVLAALSGTNASRYVKVIEESVMRMRNVAEIALVMDASGSMNDSTLSGGTRMSLLKEGSKKLVSDLVAAGQQITNATDSVKFSVVPFSASVNVGANNRTANWMDQNGVSPIHHENLNWGTMGAASTPWKLNGANGAKLDASGKALTRFTILDNLKFASGGTESTLPIAPVAPALGSCRVWKSGTGTSSGSATDANCAVKDRVGTITMLRPSVTADRATLATLMGTTDAALKEKYVWKGCVEARPYPYNLQDDSPSGSTPATYFVPMMALDEFNNVRYGITSNSSTTSGDSGSGNNWWPESVTATSRLISDSTANYTSAGTPSTAWKVSTGRDRFADATKYYNETPYLLGSSSTVSAANVTSTSSSVVRKGQWHYFKADPGVNVGCTTTPITPLTGTESTVISAINALQPTGNTNVTEGLAWGWRTVSAEEPFSEGVANTNRGVDKVIIVFTDGANTYSAMSANADYAAQVSTYAAYGYTGWANNTASTNTGTQIGASNKARIFQGTTLGQTTANYSTAMITQMGELCTNIKAGDRILLMTVALDLDKTVSSENQMITALKNCAGTSKTRKTSSGDPEKMFWNACTRTVSDGSCTPLDDTFKQIKDELSNLRFVG